MTPEETKAALKLIEESGVGDVVEVTTETYPEALVKTILALEQIQ